jgi:hypothetical protein
MSLIPFNRRISRHILPTIIGWWKMGLHMGLFDNVCYTWVWIKRRYNMWLRWLECRVDREV